MSKYADPAAEFRVGEQVEVHAMGHWYVGEVVKVTAKVVTVRYTSGTGVTRDKRVPLTPGAGDYGKVRRPGEESPVGWHNTTGRAIR